MPTRTVRTSLSIGAAALCLAIGAVACTPDPTVPSSTVPSSTVPAGPTITADRPLSDIDPAGELVTITGSGFTTTGNIGTRPPLAGQPAGVYVTFGRFADTWKPSAGAPSSARQIISQNWAAPMPSYNVISSVPGSILLNADGTFTAQLQIAPAAGTNPNYAVAVYPGSGASNPAEELLLPVSFAPETP